MDSGEAVSNTVFLNVIFLSNRNFGNEWLYLGNEINTDGKQRRIWTFSKIIWKNRTDIITTTAPLPSFRITTREKSVKYSRPHYHLYYLNTPTLNISRKKYETKITFRSSGAVTSFFPGDEKSFVPVFQSIASLKTWHASSTLLDTLWWVVTGVEIS